MAYHEDETDEGLYLIDCDLVDLNIQNSTYIQYIDPTAKKKKKVSDCQPPTATCGAARAAKKVSVYPLNRKVTGRKSLPWYWRLQRL